MCLYPQERRGQLHNNYSQGLDLIFQLLHETVHAVRDEEPGQIDVEEEEAFCDIVAELTQFPDFYVNMVARSLKGINNGGKIVNNLKAFSKENAHSLWGIYYRLNHKGLFPEELNVGGAATNLNKGFPTLRDILFSDNDPRYYVDMLYALTPNFMSLVAEHIPDCSVRRLGEWLGLESSMDAKAVMEEMVRIKGRA